MPITSVNLPEETRDRADKYAKILGYTSRSKFVAAAIDHYIDGHRDEIAAEIEEAEA